MGFLRFLLALSVVINHSTAIFGFYLVGGRVAVESFFIISGFYMAMILSEKYQQNFQGYRLFLTNRFLRIYPIYWAMALVTLSAVVVVGVLFSSKLDIGWFNSTEPLGFWAVAYVIVVHVVVFGQDALVFTKYSDTLLVPQSWTLALEMMFYLIAPFLVRKKTWALIVLVVGSIGLRILLWRAGFNYDPWTYRFFPAELAFFIAGMLTFRLYRFLHVRKLFFKKVSWALYAAVIGATLFYQYIPLEDSKKWAYYILLIIALPWIFELTKLNKKDRRIGEFSYPIYICHIFALALAKKIFMPAMHIAPENLGLMTALFAVVLSYLLLKYIGDPIERFRHRKVILPA